VRSESELGRGDRHDDGSDSTEGFHRPTLTLMGAVVLGAALRIPGLVDRPLWLDEALQAHISGAPSLTEVLQRSAALDLHPPGFAIAASVAVQFFGTAEWVFRCPSLIAGVITVPLAWLAGRAWADDRIANTLALAAAVCPPWVAYAREARPYAGAIAWILALLWAAGEHRQQPTPATAAALVLCGTGGLLWQYTSGVVALGVFAGLLAFRPRDRATWTATVFVLIVGMVLAIGTLRQQLADRVGPLVDTDLARVFSPLDLIGYCAVGPSSSTWIIGLLLLPLVVRRVPRDVAITAGLPIAALFSLSLAGLHPFGGLRQCLVLTPGLLLLGAHHHYGLGRGLSVGLAAAIAVQFYRFPGVPLWDLPGIAIALEAEHRGEPVWIDPRLGRTWDRYGPAIEATKGTWKQPSPPDQRPLWVVAPNRNAEGLPGQATKQLASEGVNATLWISD
jgi:hypothetical protein